MCDGVGDAAVGDEDSSSYVLAVEGCCECGVGFGLFPYPAGADGGFWVLVVCLGVCFPFGSYGFGVVP